MAKGPAFMERKYLLRLLSRPIYERERFFYAARPILERMQTKGYATRVKDELDNFCWEITDAGRSVSAEA